MSYEIWKPSRFWNNFWSGFAKGLIIMFKTAANIVVVYVAVRYFMIPFEWAAFAVIAHNTHNIYVEMMDRL